MTVKELIELLQTFPEGAPVLTYDSDESGLWNWVKPDVYSTTNKNGVVTVRITS